MSVTPRKLAYLETRTMKTQYFCRPDIAQHSALVHWMYVVRVSAMLPANLTNMFMVLCPSSKCVAMPSKTPPTAFLLPISGNSPTSCNYVFNNPRNFQSRLHGSQGKTWHSQKGCDCTGEWALLWLKNLSSDADIFLGSMCVGNTGCP